MSQPTLSSPGERLAGVIGSLWWVPLVRGIMLAFIGAYALFRPGMTAVAFTQVIAVLLIVEGVLALASAFLGETPSRTWTMARGALAILIGLFVFGFSAIIAGITVTVVMYIIAFSMILSGVLEITAAIRDRKEMEGEGWLILGGGLSVVFGALILMAPIAFGLVIVRIIGVFALLYGISLIALAIRMRKFGKSLRE